MSVGRDSMIQALKEHVVPVLRGQGFKGSFPHFRRASAGRLDLLMFQFDMYGGGFVAEISVCPPDGITTSWGERVPPAKVTIPYLSANRRPRLKPEGSQWFRYDTEPDLPDTYDRLAQQILVLIDQQAEPWWAAQG